MENCDFNWCYWHNSPLTTNPGKKLILEQGPLENDDMTISSLFIEREYNRLFHFNRETVLAGIAEKVIRIGR